MAKHDLIFFEKRSTPKIVPHGKPFQAPPSYGKQTKRRPATEDEERQIARGVWLRVDEHGTKGGQPGYKKTQMPGREHLVHYGVKGMHWGVRHDSALTGVPPKTNREAKKDAEEFTRAKLFYGQGAGNRRKLIKATVEAKIAKDPSYKKAFDYHVANTDLSKRASQARSERKRKDVVGSTKKTARGVNHILNGNAQYASLAASLAVGGYMYAKKTGIDQVILKHAKKTMADVRRANGDRSSGMSYQDVLRNLHAI